MNNIKNKNILHITPHFGGGVGRVLLNYLIKTRNNKVICLDYANENAEKTLKNNQIEFIQNAYLEPQKMLEEIKNADIVLIHWWNHPLLFEFLVKQTLPPARIIFWSHISGFHSPYVFTEKALSYPDLFVFTTPLSFETNEVKAFQEKNKLKTVWSTGGVEHVKNIQPKHHTGFNIGYIGTVDYCKIHPDFIKICSKINIPDAKFIVCGGNSHEEIKQQAEAAGISDKFVFTGLITDINKYLEIFDVFGYPLAPYHYGTCDQVLAESMAAGVVPVVFSNKMEKYMVKDKITGLVANNEEEYIQAIEFLYNNAEYKNELSQNARKYAQETFSLNTMIKDWEKLFQEVLNMPKSVKKWKLNIAPENLSYSDIFLEALGTYGEDFKFNRVEKIKELAKSPIWQTKTRGTVHHYCEFFKDDKTLHYWSQLISRLE